MSRRRRHALILSSVALLTLIALGTAHTSVGAWGRMVDDPRVDEGLSEAPLEGRTFQVKYMSACYLGPQPDTWYFAVSGHLIGETLGEGSSWRQRSLSEWSASVVTSCGQYVVTGRAFGPIIFGTGISGQAYPPYFWVVGMRERI